jgi:hypothetical protein
LLLLGLPRPASSASLSAILPSSAYPGDKITISGNGAYQVSTPNNIDIYISNFGSYRTIVTSTGTFSIDIAVPPNVHGGEHLAQISSSLTGEALGAIINILPRIYTNVSSGRTGDLVALTGVGFIPGSPIQLFFFNKTFGSSPTSTSPVPIVVTAPLSSSSGSLYYIFTIPKYPAGVYSIIGSDTVNSSAGAPFTVTPSVSLPNSTGTTFTESDQLLINGTGFMSNSNISFQIDATPLAGYTAATLADGTFSTSITIPALARGLHNVTASDTVKNISPASSFTFGTSIHSTPMYGTAGSTVTIKGSGFDGARPISITYDGSLVVTTPAVVTSSPVGAATAAGIFSATFVVPGSLGGEHKIIASDGANSATTTFTSSLSASITPITSDIVTGYVGQEITVDGKGFNPAAVISVKYDSTQVGSATATNLGVFSVKFKAPVSKAGVHSVTASDGVNTRTFTYIVESSAPPAPTLVTPPDLTNSKQPITFEWSQVTDISGVTYTLQVSQDPAFANLILSKQGLKTATYTLIDGENLPSTGAKSPYVWRVMAVDGAGNISSPSAPGKFIIGFTLDSLPLSVLFAAGMAGPVLLGGGVFLLFRRLSSSRSS